MESQPKDGEKHKNPQKQFARFNGVNLQIWQLSLLGIGHDAWELAAFRVVHGRLDNQVDQHARFIEAAYDFAHRFNDGEGENLRKEVYGFLCDWLIKHIREEDQRYKPAPKN